MYKTPNMVTKIMFRDGDVMHLLPGEQLLPHTARLVVRQEAVTLASVHKDLARDKKNEPSFRGKQQRN